MYDPATHPGRFARGAARTAACLFALTSIAHAHVTLDAPSGGEVLRAGSTYTIRWHVVAQHTTLNWDLWYSTTGSNGPWLPIAMDLAPGDTSAGARHTYDWVVPPTPSDRVRVRVRQDNTRTDYFDVSSRDLSIVPSLTGDRSTISLGSGGTQQLALDAGPGRAGATYLVLGSLTGTAPGFRVGSVLVPLAADSYTVHTVASPNTPPLSSSLGVLGRSGTGSAAFSLPPGLGSSLVGLVIYHAFITVDRAGRVDMASNPVSVTLTR